MVSQCVRDFLVRPAISEIARRFAFVTSRICQDVEQISITIVVVDTVITIPGIYR